MPIFLFPAFVFQQRRIGWTILLTSDIPNNAEISMKKRAMYRYDRLLYSRELRPSVRPRKYRTKFGVRVPPRGLPSIAPIRVPLKLTRRFSLPSLPIVRSERANPSFSMVAGGTHLSVCTGGTRSRKTSLTASTMWTSLYL